MKRPDLSIARILPSEGVIPPAGGEERDGYPDLLSVEHGLRIGISRPLWYTLLNRGDLPVVQIGRRKFMRRDDFMNWLGKGGERND